MRKIYWYDIIWVTVLALVPFVLAGCVSEGAAFGLGAGSLHETVMTEKKTNTQPVYGPPQIIYRIDDNRYFTLENYTRCENGQTFYNNKAKNIHIKVSNASGYLFKGRLFWLSTRDDYLAFPATANSDQAACIGSDKGCMNAVAVTIDAGETIRSVTYGSYTQDPTGATEDYDMLVTNDGFYMIEYAFPERTPTGAYALKWTFHPNEESTKKYGYPGASGPVYQPELSFDVSSTIQETMQCDRRLEPVQSVGSKIQ